MSEILATILQVTLLIFNFAMFLSSVVGNSVIIYVISRDEKLKSKSNYHILSVAVADLLIGLFGIPVSVSSVSWIRHRSRAFLNKM